ncbi:MAG: hypothetical protein C4532_16245 [Candidatus Abyssobacteria bacterium SURF_17]|uniref:Uncharacterized protein n=1 Tax=Candidatus Abyssobacteria bacterium SURF_17 TaxID=2093361 RepID=A0A419ESB7_9BACT|nr:MAG: hypothetical protein C4532_16245 [Candidatus Abyssubacteria bacterium SURF_17]
MGKRVSYSDEGIAFEVRIAVKKQLFALLFLPVWLAGWTIGGITAFKQVVSDTPTEARTFLIVWLLGWFLGEVFAVYTWCWMAFGKEIIRVGSGLMTVRRAIGTLGRSKTFQTMYISDLRAVGYFGNLRSLSTNMAMLSISGGTVAFDYQGKTHRFGIQLEEQEAREVVERLRPYLPESAASEHP